MCCIGFHHIVYDFRAGDYRLLVGGGGKGRCVRCGKSGLVDSQGNIF